MSSHNSLSTMAGMLNEGVSALFVVASTVLILELNKKSGLFLSSTRLRKLSIR
jgi:hypothetical protein